MTGVRKQRSQPVDWLDVAERCTLIPDSEVEVIIDRAVAGIAEVANGRRVGIAWSGGKDSQVTRMLAERAGVTRGCCILTHPDLEVPSFDAWARDNAGSIEIVRRSDWDLDWLGAHPGMVFPTNSRDAALWFRGIQWWGQRKWCLDNDIDVLLMGRRALDGNYAGPNGNGCYRDPKGFWRHAAIWSWTHEQVFATIDRLGLPLAPCYQWPRGWRVATGPWPKRRRLASEAETWAEVETVDPDIVRRAAKVLPGARAYLEGVA